MNRLSMQITRNLTLSNSHSLPAEASLDAHVSTREDAHKALDRLLEMMEVPSEENSRS